MPVIGVLPLARPTFDVPYAEEMAAACFKALEATGHRIVGARDLLFDGAATEAALAALKGQNIDLLLILQVTFTDASMTVRIAKENLAPLAIWAVPEPRAGGRLRLNSFCGLNLAAHALGLAGIPLRWLYSAPDAHLIQDAIGGLVIGDERDPAFPTGSKPSLVEREQAKRVLASLKGRSIGLVGEHPFGFDTCAYDAGKLAALAGVDVKRIALPEVFESAKMITAAQIAATRADVADKITGLDGVDQGQLDKSLSVYHALDGLKTARGCSAMAVRCWPEMFTDYGCAACGPMGLMTEAKTPCACEADVYGALTGMLMQEVAGAPTWLVDIVDMDAATNTGVFWHCGSAPLSMADDQFQPRAQLHSNRKMPLLQEFTLKPGRVSIARISQARSQTTMILAGGEMLRAPMSFTGTSGVVRFDRSAEDVTEAMLEFGLEHHVALVYGEHRGVLRALGQEMGLRVVELA
ncbi:MAG: L-fucose/L-arabinose isomerase family protein [Bosea sp. (in: a-proteobacteria)]